MYGCECELREKIKCYYSTCKKLMVWIRNSTCIYVCAIRKIRKSKFKLGMNSQLTHNQAILRKHFSFEEAKSDFKIILKKQLFIHFCTKESLTIVNNLLTNTRRNATFIFRLSIVFGEASIEKNLKSFIF